MSELSDDAKGLFSCLWGMPIGKATVLKFRMCENRPTARAQAALDELVAAGFLCREQLSGGGFSYRPLGPEIPHYRRFVRMGDFALTEPIKEEPRA